MDVTTTVGSGTAALRLRDRLATLAMVAAWAYGAILCALAIVYQRLVDEVWWATALGYLPRWPFMVPVLALVPFVLLRHRRRSLGLALAVSAWLVLGPILGLELPGFSYRPGSQRDLRIMTNNIAAYSESPDEALAVAEANGVDIALLQECRFPWPEPPPAQVQGWYLFHAYGMCLFSRHPIQSGHERDPSDFWKRGGSGLMHRVEIKTPVGLVTVVNLHLETPRDAVNAVLGEQFAAKPEVADNLALRDDESRVARAFVAEAQGPVIVAGDFNLVQESAMYRRYWSDLQNAFDAVGIGFGRTKSTRWHGVRIDHVLVSDAFTPRRAFTIKSFAADHSPVIVDLELSR